MFEDFDWLSWVGLVCAAMAGGLVIFWTVAGYYHIRYYVRRRDRPEEWKCQPRRFLPARMQREAMRLSTMNLAIGGFITGTLIYGLLHGLQTPIYFEVAQHGWLYTLVSTVLLFVLVDGAAYYAHRLLHNKFLFRHVHRWHHRYVATTPFVTIAMHPAEFLVLQAATFLPLFLIPFHYASIIAVFVYVLVFNIIDHSGVKLQSMWPWQGPSKFHDDHHVYFHVNFGQHLGIFDRVHGTMRRVGRRYGEKVFGGKGAPDGTDSPSEFVKY